jgi:hypothetical protein
MSSQYLTRREEPQVPPYPAAEMTQGLYTGLARFLAPLLMELDTCIDKRLVRTDLANGGGHPDLPGSGQRIAALGNGRVS